MWQSCLVAEWQGRKGARYLSILQPCNLQLFKLWKQSFN